MFFLFGTYKNMPYNYNGTYMKLYKQSLNISAEAFAI